MKNTTSKFLLILFTTFLFASLNFFAQDQINFVTYGPQASINEGDDDFLQVFFIEFSQAQSDAVSLQIFDPDCKGEFDSRFGEFNSHFTFRLYNGKGVYSDPKVRTTHPDIYIINEGNLLAELKTNNISEGDNEWVTLKEFNPADGELFEGKHYFKLVVEGIAGNDANVFNLRVIGSDNSSHVNIFNYCPTVRLDERSRPIQMKFIAPVDEPVIVHNFDTDNKPLFVVTPFRSELMLNSSGDGNWMANGVKFLQIEKDNLCALQFGPGSGTVNDATFYIEADENVLPIMLPIETRKKNSKPEILYSVDYTDNCNELVLNASATDSDSDQFRFKWFFNDGQIVEGKKTNKIYPLAGKYGVTLVAYDNSDAIENGNFLKTNLIVNEPPAAVAGEDFTSMPVKSITFDGSKSFDDDGKIITYEWNFGDGERGTGIRSKHSFAKAGHYQVVLKVTDNSPSNCNYDFDTVNVWINDKPLAKAGKDLAVSIGEKFTLDASASSDNDGSITNYFWDFDDGNKAYEKIVSHSYNKPGKYVAKLRITDNASVANSSTTDEVVITVNNPPVANAGKDIIVALNEVVEFDAEKSVDLDGSIIKYEWNFGDGSSNNGSFVKHSYNKSGKYTVNLTVVDNSGTSTNTSLDERIVTVNAKPIADGGKDIYQTIPLVTFDAKNSNDTDGQITNYLWDFGDGNSAKGAVVSNTYDKPGNYTTILKVVDNTSVSNNFDYDTISVVINSKPIADAGPNMIAAPGETIAFSGNNSIDADGTIDSYAWILNGKEIANKSEYEYSFKTPGVYDITLIVRDNSGHIEAVDKDITTVIVNAAPTIVAEKMIYVAPSEKFTLDASKSFDDDDSNLNYEWYMESNVVSTSNEYSTSYSTPGVRKILLKLSDDKGAVNSLSQQEIVVSVNHAPIPKTKNELFLCSRIITLNAEESFDSDGDNLNYSWNVGGGKILEGSIVKHNFKKSGVFPVILTVDDGKGLSNSLQFADVKVVINTPPVANAGADLIVCSGDVVNLSGSESFDDDGDLLKYNWDFGDGSVAEGLTVTKVYNQGGIYSVTLTVTDNSGLECNQDIDTKVLTVIESPVAFAGPDLIACTNSEVNFDASKSTDSDGIVNNFSWDYGDGESGGGAKSTHIYKKPGEYKVLLSITGELVGECDNTDIDELIVTVTDAPFAIFESLDSVAVGTSINFDAAGSVGNNGNIKNYSWDFGDSNTATGRIVDHEYQKFGNYAVTLRIETETNSDCKTSVYKKSININATPIAASQDEYQAIIGESVLLDASGSKDPDGQITKYVWNLGNGVIKEGIKIRHTFLEVGKRDISLTVFDNTKLVNSSNSKTIYVNVADAY